MNSLKKILVLSLMLVASVFFAQRAGAAERDESTGAAETVTLEELELNAEVSMDMLVVGSDGKEYENVDYLSVEEVNLFSSSQRTNYEQLCDKAAELTNSETGYTAIELVTGNEGRPELRYYLPVKQIILMAEDNGTEPDVYPSGEVMEQAALYEASAAFDRGAFYRDQLSSTEQELFDRCVAAAAKNKNVFYADGSGFGDDDFFRIFSTGYLAYPELFEWVNWSGKGFTSLSLDDFGSEYYGFKAAKSKYFSANTEEKARKKINNLVAAARRYAEAASPEDVEYGIAEYLDKWICKKNYYNNKGTKNAYAKKAVMYYCHSSYGCLLKGYGVCESYARAMSRLLDAAGIANFFLCGEAGEAFGETGGHAWNYVRLGDSWYLLDTTWDDAGKKSDRSYFLIGSSDEDMQGTVHDATGEIFYYIYPSVTYPQLSKYSYKESDWPVLFEPAA
ncbi:MAG TPA: hypothetical protein DCL38_04405 [Lachnospiraceae bacterium]|nr:hypothetical protein [Lachnospiraceae bacterium]